MSMIYSEELAAAVRMVKHQAAELSRMRTALEELVACKDLKERMANEPYPVEWTYEQKLAESGARRDAFLEYERRQPLAWKAARAAIAERALTAGSGNDSMRD